jgi:hypothetical protein
MLLRIFVELIGFDLIMFECELKRRFEQIEISWIYIFHMQLQPAEETVQLVEFMRKQVSGMCQIYHVKNIVQSTMYF